MTMEPDDVTFQLLQDITEGFSDKQRLGEGSFGVVYRGVTHTGEDVAVKMFKHNGDNTNADSKQFKNEIYHLAMLKHENIVQVLGYCYEIEKKPMVFDGKKVLVEEIHRGICLEYLHKGSLKEYLSDDESGGLDWYTRFKIIRGTCEGLKYIRDQLENPLYHLDLKPENILLDKYMVPKIADFGLSRIFGKELKRTTQNPYGTLGYQPPEYIERGEISEKFDIFSLGVVVIRIVSGSCGYPKCLDMSSDEFIDQVQRNWRVRLQKTYNGSSLEAYCHQVETCTQIALSCVENDSQKRPGIVTINKKLNEIEIDNDKFSRKGCCCKTISGPAMHGNKIEMTKESMGVIHGHQNLNLITGLNCRQQNFLDAQKLSSDVVEELIVGRAEEKDRVMASLHKVMSEKIVILPIHGIEGIGKTTFARLIYNDPEFKTYSQVWVHVSPRFNLIKICRSIVSQLSGDEENQANERQMMDICLSSQLSGKKILIVLDDLWEHNQFNLKELKDVLYNKESNIIILVTTRSEDVADRICTNLQPYKLLPLTNDMCWDIIKQRSGFEVRNDKEKLKGIGEEIAKKCGGIALAARSLGFTLRSMKFDQWIKVKDSYIWNEPVSNDVSLPNHVLASLKLSYNYMAPCLKRCFTYCAIFPKGHKIVKHDLIYQWISLDFINPTKLLSHTHLGERYIVQLMGLSFLQHSVSPKTIGTYLEDVTVFTMHDLVHDLATSVKADGTLDVSKQGKTGVSVMPFALKESTYFCSKIRGLRFVETVFHGASSPPANYLSFLVFGNIEHHDYVFLSSKYLRVLDLSECSIQKLPDSIGNLKHLRYLNAPRVQHQVIVDCITNISKLIYLSLRGSSAILALPESIGEMEGLVYLDLLGCSRIKKLPVSFGNLKKLVHLDLSKCSQVTFVSESLNSLTNLEYLDLSYCSNIGDVPEHFGSLSKLRSLNLSYSSFIEGIPNTKVMATLTKLEYLNLASKRSCIRNLPEALSRLTNLKYLNLSGLDRKDLLTSEGPIIFGNLKSLVSLDLSYCKGVDSILEAFGSLTRLQYLNLSHVCNELYPPQMSKAMGNLTELRYLNVSGCSIIEDEAFSIFLERISNLTNLENLDLSRNRNLTSVPDCFCGLRKLHTLDLSGCSRLQNLPTILNEMDSLKFINLEDCRELIMPTQLNRSMLTLPQFLVQADCHDSGSNLVLLRDVDRADLMISRLENVKSLQEAQSINLVKKEKMEEMEVNWTEGAERFVEDMEVLGELVPPKTLLKLRLDGYNGVRLPKWFVGRIDIHLPNLKEVGMHNLPQCNSLPPLGELPNLVSISLSNLPKCSSLPQLGQLCSLRQLVLERMNGITEIDWDLCGSRRAFPKLKHFILREMDSLKVWHTRYPGGQDDGLSEFMFPNISYLEICDCPNLRLTPGLHRAVDLSIHGRSDGLISSSWEEGSNQCYSRLAAQVTDLHVDGCKMPMHQWRMLHQLPALGILSIRDCSDLSSSPEIIQALSSSLWSLTLDHNHQPKLPSWLGRLTSLEYLTLRGYNAMALNDAFPRLTRLHSLCLKDFVSMTELPQSVGDLVSLQLLEIAHCPNLKDLPDSIGRLRSLNNLSIIYCTRITSLPQSICHLTSLKRLEISNCDRITCLPEWIRGLTSRLKTEVVLK